MKIHKVISTAVREIGYDRKTKKLAVKFIGGNSYIFKNVGKDQFTAMRKADSLGKFMNTKILGKYESQAI